MTGSKGFLFLSKNRRELLRVKRSRVREGFYIVVTGRVKVLGLGLYRVS